MINNDFYLDLGEKWLNSRHDAIALLRIEGQFKSPWVYRTLLHLHGDRSLKILDVGCGSGDLLIYLRDRGYNCTGLDVSERILEVGRKRASDVNWVVGSSHGLPFKDESFDVVCVMDVLEHVSDPKQMLRDAVRVLRPEGTLLFHTFNRTILSWLFAAKGLDWFIKDSPKNIHNWDMFIKPAELANYLSELGAGEIKMTGISPKVFSLAMLKLIFTRKVPEDFSFTKTRSLRIGYLGSARKIDPLQIR